MKTISGFFENLFDLNKKYKSGSPEERASDKELFKYAKYNWYYKVIEHAIRKMNSETLLEKLLQEEKIQRSEPFAKGLLLCKLKRYTDFFAFMLSREFDYERSVFSAIDGGPDISNREFGSETDKKLFELILDTKQVDEINNLILNHPSGTLKYKLLKAIKKCPHCGGLLSNKSYTTNKTISGPGDSFYRSTETYEFTSTENHLICPKCNIDFDSKWKYS